MRRTLPDSAAAAGFPTEDYFTAWGKSGSPSASRSGAAGDRAARRSRYRARDHVAQLIRDGRAAGTSIAHALAESRHEKRRLLIVLITAAIVTFVMSAFQN
jgi:hypothetical protein